MTRAGSNARSPEGSAEVDRAPEEFRDQPPTIHIVANIWVVSRSRVLGHALDEARAATDFGDHAYTYCLTLFGLNCDNPEARQRKVRLAEPCEDIEVGKRTGNGALRAMVGVSDFLSTCFLRDQRE